MNNLLSFIKKKMAKNSEIFFCYLSKSHEITTMTRDEPKTTTTVDYWILWRRIYATIFFRWFCLWRWNAYGNFFRGLYANTTWRRLRRRGFFFNAMMIWRRKVLLNSIIGHQSLFQRRWKLFDETGPGFFTNLKIKPKIQFYSKLDY